MAAGTLSRVLLSLSEYHPVVIEGMGRYDPREPAAVAATISRRLHDHWDRNKMMHEAPRGKILVTQGDPLAERGISAITRAVAAELGIPRALVCLDEVIDPSHARDADRHGVVLELTYSHVAAALEATGPASLEGLTVAVEEAISSKNAARDSLGKPRLADYYKDYSLLQEVTKAGLKRVCGGNLTVAHTAAEISPFSVTSFFEIGLAAGTVVLTDMVPFEDAGVSRIDTFAPSALPDSGHEL